jgi:hypothetical protein
MEKVSATHLDRGETMRRNIMLAAAVVAVSAAAPATSLAARASAASVQTQLRNAQGAILRAFGAIGSLKANDAATANGIQTLSSHIKGLSDRIGTLEGDVTGINAQLSAGASALTAINSALTNSTTGLVGLNNARPQFGAFQNNGTIIAGTGQVSGASGPKTNATEGAGALANFYVVDFGNDVSKRFLSMTQFPTGGASTNRAALAVDCAATGVAALCGGVQGIASDASPNHVVVQFGSAGSGAADGSWEVAAISG